MASESRFGYEWDKYSKILPQYEEQFINWVKPLTEIDFKNKTVFDAGCGMGRNSYYALKYGAKYIVGIDNDEKSVNAARKNLNNFENAEIKKISIYEIDTSISFDIVFSIGVIHHLENPGKAIGKLVEILKPGGKILIWVYSYEGNEWIDKHISPIRKVITSKIPISLLHYITYMVSIPFFLYLKLFKSNNLYFQQISKYLFSHLHSIIFDQLLPEIAHYWTKEEACSLLKQVDLKEVSIHRPPNGMGWTVIGKKRSN
jgi:SAM-dependent methyltransferase